jgi:hypothetical protein
MKYSFVLKRPARRSIPNIARKPTTKTEMKFNPLTKEVYTDQGEFVKTLNCPYKVVWDNLKPTNSSSRKCTNCDHLVLDTEALTDDELLKIVRQNPATCLKIDLHQHNLQIVSNATLQQK